MAGAGRKPDPAQGRRFEPFFTAACIYLRTQADATENAVADLVGLKAVSIERFEQRKNFPDKNLTLYAAAYAEVSGISDGRKVMRLALDWWDAHGRRPLTAKERDSELEGDYTPAQIIREITRAEELEQAEPQPTSTRRRRASGE